MQRVHFNENAGCCRAHNAAYIRFSALKINEEPRKKFHLIASLTSPPGNANAMATSLCRRGGRGSRQL